MAECGEALKAARRLRTAKARQVRDERQAQAASDAGLSLAEYRRAVMRALALKSAQARRQRRIARMRISEIFEALAAERDCE